jgi:DNA repair photolyase
MKRKTNVILQQKSSYALRPQAKLGQYDFPFTLNPITGCFMGCKYCFSPRVVYERKPDRRKRFFTNAIVKMDKAEHLEKELTKYKNLPQCMKRVQVNETSEYYQSQVLSKLKSKKYPDLMEKMLEVFKKHWDNGNYWMVHILTKSNLILNHLDILQDMKEMIQVEISFATYDDQLSRRLEFYTPSIKKRYEVVDKLSSAGIFVRIMAMPFYGKNKDLKKLKIETFNRGAKAFKNKGLNYFKSWDELKKQMSLGKFLNAKLSTGKGRVDKIKKSYIIRSGEYVKTPKKYFSYRTVSVPTMNKKFVATDDWGAITLMNDRFEKRKMKVIKCGYKSCNNIDWGYII